MKVLDRYLVDSANERFLFLRLCLNLAFAYEFFDHFLFYNHHQIVAFNYFSWPALLFNDFTFFLFAICASILAGIGYFTKITAAAVLICKLVEYNHHILYYNNHFYLELILAGLLLFAAFSPKKNSSSDEPDNVINFFFLALQAMLFLVYFYAGLAKVLNPFKDALAYAGILLDFYLAFFVLVRPFWSLAGIFLLILGVCFHVSTVFIFNIGIFPYMMLAMLLGLILQRNILAPKTLFQHLN